MVSQLMMVPAILKASTSENNDLESLGEVVKSDEGWIVNYIARVSYFGDDEMFVYCFWHEVASKNMDITQDDFIRFDWDRVEKVRLKLP